jgi:uncharacterized peroxidase-related enzyme
MPRLKPVDPASATGRAKEILEGPLKGKHFNIFKSMANSPAALDVYLGIAGALGKAGLSDKEREVVQLAVGQANGCDYCVAAHTAIGKGAGLSEAQTIDARKGRVAGDARLNAVAAFATALHEKRGHVSDADLAAFKGAGFGDGHVAEVVATYALAVFTNYFNHVNQTPVDFPDAPAI